MFPADSLVQAVSGGGGNRTRERSPQKRDEQIGWVYFIQQIFCEETAPIKIGWSGNPFHRCDYLDRRNGSRGLDIIGLFPGYRSEERALHRRWSEHRVLGEWFRPHAEIRATAELCLALHLDDFMNGKCAWEYERL